jgi:hypothetical protein
VRGVSIVGRVRVVRCVLMARPIESASVQLCNTDASVTRPPQLSRFTVRTYGFPGPRAGMNPGPREGDIAEHKPTPSPGGSNYPQFYGSHVR